MRGGSAAGGGYVSLDRGPYARQIRNARADNDRYKLAYYAALREREQRGRFPPRSPNIQQIMDVISTHDNIGFILDFIKTIPDINMNIGGFGTALNSAAYNGRKFMVRALLDAGADVNRTNHLNMSAV